MPWDFGLVLLLDFPLSQFGYMQSLVIDSWPKPVQEPRPITPPICISGFRLTGGAAQS